MPGGGAPAQRNAGAALSAADKEAEELSAALNDAAKEAEELTRLTEQTKDALEKAKVMTMYKMVDAIDTTVNDSRTEVQCLYMTNEQAGKVSIATMPEIRKQLKIDVPEEPKMVIRLMPSHFGKAYQKTFQNYSKDREAVAPTSMALRPGSACTTAADTSTCDADVGVLVARERVGRFPAKAIPELTEEAEGRTEHQLLLLAKDVLLPLAISTQSLVIGSESCSLTAAFVQVSAQVQRQMGENCPFSLLIFARAYFYELMSQKDMSVAAAVKRRSRGWKDATSAKSIDGVLRESYGEDPSFWPEEDLPTGKYSLIMFECVGRDGKMAEEAYNKFTNDFITSMSQKVPVVALQTYGTNKMCSVPALAEHVSRGLPLMLLNSRGADYGAAEAGEEGRKRTKGRNSKEEKELETASKQLKNFRRNLHEATGRIDQYFMSALALVKEALDSELLHPEVLDDPSDDDLGSEQGGFAALSLSTLKQTLRVDSGGSTPKGSKKLQTRPSRASLAAVMERQEKRNREEKQLEEQRRGDGEMYIWEAISRRTGISNKTPKRSNDQTKGGIGYELEEDRIKTVKELAVEAQNRRMLATTRATNIIMDHAGSELEFEAKRQKERAERAIHYVVSATSWDDLEQRLNNSWCDIRGYAFHFFQDAREFQRRHSKWIFLDEQNKDPIEGKLVLKIKAPAANDELAQDAERLKCQSQLNEFLHRQILQCYYWDKKNKYKQAFCNNQDMWIAVYDILKADSDTVCTGSIQDLADVKKKIEFLAQTDRLPTRNSLEALVLLRTAWNIVDIYNDSARVYKRISRWTYFLALLVGLAMVCFTALCTIYPPGEYLTQQTRSRILLALALTASGLTGYSGLVDPTRKWLQLRTSAYRMESEIWQFRTRIGLYQALSSAVTGRLEDERRAEAVLQQKVLQVQGHVRLSTGLRETSFYSITMATNDLMPTGVKQGNSSCLRRVMRALCCIRSLDEQEKLCKQHYKHGQYRRSGCKRKAKPKEGKDSFHAPATPEDYIKWRLEPRMKFYQSRIPRYAMWRRAFQVLLLVCALATSLLSALNALHWTAIVAAFSCSVASAQEFLDVARKLQRYSSISNSLSNIKVKWFTLSPVEQATFENVNQLVQQVENLLDEERSAWMSEAQASQNVGRAPIVEKSEQNSNSKTA